jgi:hypothetical protein
MVTDISVQRHRLTGSHLNGEQNSGESVDGMLEELLRSLLDIVQIDEVSLHNLLHVALGHDKEVVGGK